MMAGNPRSCWSMPPPNFQHPLAPAANFLTPSHQYHVVGAPNSLPDHNQELPQYWSQLILGVLSGEEDLGSRFGPISSHFQAANNKKLEIWENQILNLSPTPHVVDVVKQDLINQNNNLLYGTYGNDELIQASSRPAGGGGGGWCHQNQMMSVSSPSPRSSCITTSSSSSSAPTLHFSYNMYMAADHGTHTTQPQPHQYHSNSECDSRAKKARVQPSSSSTQPPLKVRKEKLGDRITALHQLVSPFGKTDTASVLLEAIGYIRFLQGQIEALSSPYLATSSPNMRNQQSGQGERNGGFPEDQLGQDNQEKPKEDLRSRGLCLVPVSCTQQVGSDTAADYWAPAFGGGFN